MPMIRYTQTCSVPTLPTAVRDRLQQELERRKAVQQQQDGDCNEAIALDAATYDEVNHQAMLWRLPRQQDQIIQALWNHVRPNLQRRAGALPSGILRSHVNRVAADTKSADVLQLMADGNYQRILDALGACDLLAKKLEATERVNAIRIRIGLHAAMGQHKKAERLGAKYDVDVHKSMVDTAVALARVERHADAAMLAKRAYAQAPSDSLTLLLHTTYLLGDGAYAPVIQILHEQSAAFAADEMLQMSGAMALLFGGLTDEARHMIAGVQQNKQCIIERACRSLCYARAAQTEQAAQCLADICWQGQQAHGSLPLEKLLWPNALALMSEAASSLNSLDALRHVYKLAKQVISTGSQAFALLGQSFCQLGDQQMALEALHDAPHDTSTLHLHVKLLLQTQGEIQANALVEKAWRANPQNAEILLLKADLSLRLGRQDITLSVLQRILKLHPDNLVVRQTAITLSLAMRQYRIADGLLALACASDPSNAQFAAQRARVSAVLQNNYAALQHVQKAQRLFNKQGQNLPADSELLLAALLRDKAQFVEALQGYQRILKSDPMSLPAWVGAGQTYLAVIEGTTASQTLPTKNWHTHRETFADCDKNQVVTPKLQQGVLQLASIAALHNSRLPLLNLMATEDCLDKPFKQLLVQTSESPHCLEQVEVTHRNCVLRGRVPGTTFDGRPVLIDSAQEPHWLDWWSPVPHYINAQQQIKMSCAASAQLIANSHLQARFVELAHRPLITGSQFTLVALSEALGLNRDALFITGSAVRKTIANVAHTGDVDVVTTALPCVVRSILMVLLAKSPDIAVEMSGYHSEHHGCVSVCHRGSKILDVSTICVDGGHHRKRHVNFGPPYPVFPKVFGGDVKADVERRDFTVNGFYLELAALNGAVETMRLFDVTGRSHSDLALHQLQVISLRYEQNNAIAQTLRGLCIAATEHFSLTEQTQRLMQQSAACFARSTAETNLFITNKCPPTLSHKAFIEALVDVCYQYGLTSIAAPLQRCGDMRDCE